ncbi:hypothetical protein A2U01_0075086, partial [Trifolium medium]|nr:hypothetical protein [Trifolium medium]
MITTDESGRTEEKQLTSPFEPIKTTPL